ncbi:MAG: hypothetical protein M3063_05440 [Actinomycetota bacterium]|nr:hypothetical protein [Actinomycetota bacterium]
MSQAAGGSAVLEKLSNPTTRFVQGSTGGDRNPLSGSVQVQAYTSYLDLQHAVDTGGVSPGTRALLYDPEQWSFTPVAEQRDPVAYTRLAARLAHARSLRLIATPAVNLALLAPHRLGADKYDAFVDSPVLQLARYADIVEVQSQQLEGTPRYVSFLQAATASIRAISPTAEMLAGMSTAPLGDAVSSQSLFNDYISTRGLVKGYWLNIPQQSSHCPSCRNLGAEAAVAFLNRVR